ncbi:hypothetical protein [Streptomyces sp. NPDC048623]|uniref:hypothetical protein n=1 Tax=Streptomyces sp. NPDC048623 TaxID=3155761 RepID=UPI0034267EC8
MDAGLAAVLGALAGAVATTGAAVAAGWAQREVARITARSQHRKERLQSRQSHYREFASAAYTVRDLVKRSVGHRESSHVVTDQFSQELQTAWKALQGARLDVVLSGPDQVGMAAQKLEELASEVSREARVFIVMGMLETQGVVMSESDRRDRHEALMFVQNSATAFEEKVGEFERLAQAALEDDGSARLGR